MQWRKIWLDRRIGQTLWLRRDWALKMKCQNAVENLKASGDSRGKDPELTWLQTQYSLSLHDSFIKRSASISARICSMSESVSRSPSSYVTPTCSPTSLLLRKKQEPRRMSPDLDTSSFPPPSLVSACLLLNTSPFLLQRKSQSQSHINSEMM